MRLRLLSHAPEAATADVWSFTFLPLEEVHWRAGQSLRLEVPGPYGPLEHRFSIASPDGQAITITTRLSGSDYKNSLAAMQPGDETNAYGLEGDFTWWESPIPHILVAGGIGITPFRAMLAERATQKRPLGATLLYSHRATEQPLFKPFFDELQTAAPEFQTHYIARRLTPADILPHIATHANRLIYISGPSRMVESLYAELLAAGVDPTNILRDQFTGHLPADA